MAKLLTVYARKGGVGKSTITANLAAGLASLDKKVLLINVDGQNNSLRNLNKDVKDDKLPAYLVDLFGKGRKTIDDVKITLRENIDGIASRDVSDLIDAIYPYKDKLNGIFNTMFPKKELDKYDFIFFDLGPDESLINTMILQNVDGIILPIQAEFEGIKSINTIKGYLSRKDIPLSKIKCVVVNMLEKSKNASKMMVENVNSMFPEEMVVSPIPKRACISNASIFGQTIFDLKSAEADVVSPFVEMLKIIVNI